VPLVGARVGVEHDHAAVRAAHFTVGDVHLVVARIDDGVGRSVERRRVVVLAHLALLADLEDERAGARELEHLRVLRSTAGHPHIVLVVH
jgi:hypothetical protein